ncbi:hypothetical protein T484DRAFT_1784040 [Baffinella frigidus]|nr:hypothetical protein T484DRAFT_1784040 [Cryptophyta sp. CCMP2293]
MMERDVLRRARRQALQDRYQEAEQAKLQAAEAARVEEEAAVLAARKEAARRKREDAIHAQATPLLCPSISRGVRPRRKREEAIYAKALLQKREQQRALDHQFRVWARRVHRAAADAAAALAVASWVAERHARGAILARFLFLWRCAVREAAHKEEEAGAAGRRAGGVAHLDAWRVFVVEQCGEDAAGMAKAAHHRLRERERVVEV